MRKYSTMHERVRIERGPAGSHPCADCGRPAREWSYDGRDPGEVFQGNRCYSLDVQHYEPRCRSCHQKHDCKFPPYHAGETHPRAKLSNTQVIEIVAAKSRGERSVLLAAQYGVTETHINRLVREGRKG